MNEENVYQIPYIVHEADMARMERVNKRLAITTGATVVFAILTNAAWILHLYGVF